MTFRNRAKCKNCKEVIESKTNHDFVSCKCFKESSKALDDYINDNYTEKLTNIFDDNDEDSIFSINYEGLEKDKKYLKLQEKAHGFFLDGGQGIDGNGLGCRYGGNFSDIEWLIEDKDK